MMKKLIIFALLIFNFTYAQLSFDRTRLVFDHNNSQSQSIIVENSSRNAPYLAQAWIEDESGAKIAEPLAALPVLQRINPGQKKQVKVSFVGNSAKLPKDRESLFFINVLGVPPKDGSNQSQISVVIQSKLKLFYRPKGLPRYDNNSWINEMRVSKVNNGLRLENPTPYHIVIYGFGSQKTGKITERDVVLKPFSTETVSVKTNNTPFIYYINDFGGADSVNYTCSGATCNLSSKK